MSWRPSLEPSGRDGSNEGHNLWRNDTSIQGKINLTRLCHLADKSCVSCKVRLSPASENETRYIAKTFPHFSLKS